MLEIRGVSARAANPTGRRQRSLWCGLTPALNVGYRGDRRRIAGVCASQRHDERRFIEADTGGVRQRVSDGGTDWNGWAFAHRFGAERTDRVLSIGKQDLGSWHVTELRQVIVPKGLIDYAAAVVNLHFLLERRPD